MKILSVTNTPDDYLLSDDSFYGEFNYKKYASTKKSN